MRDLALGNPLGNPLGLLRKGAGKPPSGDGDDVFEFSAGPINEDYILLESLTPDHWKRSHEIREYLDIEIANSERVRINFSKWGSASNYNKVVGGFLIPGTTEVVVLDDFGINYAFDIDVSGSAVSRRLYSIPGRTNYIRSPIQCVSADDGNLYINLSGFIHVSTDSGFSFDSKIYRMVTTGLGAVASCLHPNGRFAYSEVSGDPRSIAPRIRTGFNEWVTGGIVTLPNSNTSQVLAVSPDGEHLAVGGKRAGTLITNLFIYKIDQVSGDLTLVRDINAGPDFSVSGGKRILWTNDSKSLYVAHNTQLVFFPDPFSSSDNTDYTGRVNLADKPIVGLGLGANGKVLYIATDANSASVRCLDLDPETNVPVNTKAFDALADWPENFIALGDHPEAIVCVGNGFSYNGFPGSVLIGTSVAHRQDRKIFVRYIEDGSVYSGGTE